MSEDAPQSLIDQATTAIQVADFSKALGLVDQAIEANPRDSETHVLRGICLAQLKQNDEATLAFRQAITLSPYNAKAYFNLAVHQYQLGNKAEALAMATEAANIDIRHGGARKLIDTIQQENTAASGPKALVPNPMDPLSMGIEPKESPSDSPATSPDATGAPRPTTAPSPAPSPGPSAPQAPISYPRTGYEAPSDHTLQFVEKMGGLWTAIGWLTVVANLAYVVLIAVMVQKYMGLSGDQAKMQAAIQADPQAGLANILSIGSWVGAILWTILDIVDRRGNFVWLLPQVLCSCCLGFITTPLYMVLGRKR